MNSFEKEIREKFPAVAEANGCFLVDVNVSADNDITITIEKDEGSIDLDDCVAIDKAFHEIWNQDEVDYSLTVTSAGLDLPFKVLRQYKKAIGEEVEVAFKGGKKMVAVLSEADEESITLKYSAKEAVEGQKKKVLVDHEDKFALSEVNSVRPHIKFE